MRISINDTQFGSITISGEIYEYDVLIRLDGTIKKRKKKLSKKQYGTSHMISLEEARYIFDEGAEKLIIGTGQNGFVELSDEAADFFRSKGCKVKLQPTPKAIDAWNEAKGKVISMFHVTC